MYTQWGTFLTQTHLIHYFIISSPALQVQVSFFIPCLSVIFYPLLKEWGGGGYTVLALSDLLLETIIIFTMISGTFVVSHLIFGVQPQLVVPFCHTILTDFTPEQHLIPVYQLGLFFSNDFETFQSHFTQDSVSHLLFCEQPQSGSLYCLTNFTPVQCLPPVYRFKLWGKQGYRYIALAHRSIVYFYSSSHSN